MQGGGSSGVLFLTVFFLSGLQYINARYRKTTLSQNKETDTLEIAPDLDEETCREPVTELEELFQLVPRSVTPITRFGSVQRDAAFVQREYHQQVAGILPGSGPTRNKPPRIVKLA